MSSFLMKKEKMGLRVVTMLLAFVLLVSSALAAAPQQVQAKSANRIEFYTSSLSLYAGEYTTINVKKMYQNGYLRMDATGQSFGVPSKINSSELKFKSSNTSIATVSSKGVVTAKKKGSAKITVTSVYNSNVKGTFKLTVSKGKQSKAKLTLEKTKATVAVGKTTTIKLKKATGLSSKSLKFTSGNKKIATVTSKGVVKGVKAGTTTITVTSGVNKKVTAKFKVTVKTPDMVSTSYSSKGKGKITLKKTSVELTQDKNFDGMTYVEDADGWEPAEYNNLRYRANEKRRLTDARAQIEIKSITGVKSSGVTYKSSNTSVAKVSSTGYVTAKKAGKAVITVTSKANKKVSAKFTVTVKNYATRVSFYMMRNLHLTTKEDVIKEFEDNNWELGEDSTYEDFVSIANTFGLGDEVYPKTADNKNVIVTSSNPDVIEILKPDYVGEQHCLLALKKGTAIITIQSADKHSLVYKIRIKVSDDETDYDIDCISVK